MSLPHVERDVVRHCHTGLDVGRLQQQVLRGLRRAMPVDAAFVATADGALEVLAAADARLLHAVTGWALEAGVLVTAMTTGRRALEDVFLDLTGRSLR